MATKKTAPNSTETVEAASPIEGAAAFAGAWSDAARDQYEAAMQAFTDNAEALRAQTENSFATTRQGFEAANERLRNAGADAFAAAREEMTDAVDFANGLARAKSFADALELQREYWTRLFETRVERSRAMTEATVEATREMFEPVNRSFSASFSMAPSFEKFFPFGMK